MALKDIRTNLENYKFGISDPQRIDAQIEGGVDFFDDLEGGVIKGFTTKVVAGEHQTEYRKFYEGTPVGPRSHSGTYYADLNPIASRESIYRDESGNYVLPDTGVNTNPPGTESGILKFTPPQTTLSLEDGFPNPILNYIDNARKLQNSQTLLDPLTFTTELGPLYTSEISIGRSPQLIVQPSLARPNFTQPAVNWTFLNSPNQQFTETLDGVTHSSLVDTLLTFEPEGDLFGQFTKVPSGLNEQNNFGIDTFRNVANTGPDEGKNLHPVILRPITSTFNENNEFTNLFGIQEINNTFITVSLIDKQRLQKVYDRDIEQGEIIIGKQKQLQRFNTNINTRVLQPFSIIGMANNFEDATDIEKTPFYSPLRYSDTVTFTETFETTVRGPRDSFQDTGNNEFGFSEEEEETITYEELVTRELNFPDGAGQNSLGRLFKNRSLSVGAMIDAYPNRYNNPEGVGELKSSAPITIDKGIPSFVGSSTELAQRDINKVSNKVGGNFHSQTNVSNLERYATLSYGMLSKKFSYEKTLFSPSEKLENEEIYENTEKGTSLKGDGRTNLLEVQRFADKGEIADKIGNQGSLRKDMTRKDLTLGFIKGRNDGGDSLSDTINMITPFNTEPSDVKGEEVDTFGISGGEVKDFIKFRFFDVIGQRYIILRAILSGISDSITTEYGEEKYMGRPDKLYVYKGADRDVSFTFKLYPKTKQELPVLIEKLDYVVGLCYPTYTTNNRMRTPFMELTIGDMFVDAPGILRSVNVTVEDNTTWEIDAGLQFPKHISVACQFRYIGSGDLITARANSDGALPVHYGGIRRTPNSLTKFYQGNGVEENQQSALGRAVDAYLGDTGFVNIITEFADDPVDFFEDALESLGSTFKGWLS
tara:strand:+ start:2615 stop:5245 length:2631 start_codon:yes stop_codon:yes gene_type:complete